ncbi:uncharacterized protein isoform X2 [Choristoneura fumiferana]
MGENITLSELWTDSPCNKEITLSEATNDIQLRAHSIRITQVNCKDGNNVSLNLTTRVIHADTFYKITNPEAGIWNCSFRSQLHPEVSYCVIHLKDFSDTSSDKQFKVHEILSWCSLLVAVSTAAIIILIIIIYYKRKARRYESNAIYDHVQERAPVELPSEVTYDYAYSHRISLNLKRDTTEEEQNYCNRKPNIQTTVNLNGNHIRAGYIPHDNVFV